MATLKVTRPWRQVHGMLKGKGNGVKLPIEEIDDAIAEAGAEAGMAGFQTKPSFARLLLSSPLEDGDLDPRERTPVRDVEI